MTAEMNGEIERPVLTALFALKDLKADCLTDIFTARTTTQALRQFKMMTRADPEKSLIAAFPEDWALVHLGCVRDNGLLENCHPVQLAVASDFKDWPPMTEVSRG